MKCLLFATLVVLCVAQQSDVNRMWADFKQTFNRQYKDSAEEAHRFACFQVVVKNIDDLNARDGSATYGINKFADLCPDEFKQLYHNARAGNTTSNVSSTPAVAVKQSSFDWRTQGVVTGVKNQAQCGSCWTFSAVGAMEGAWKLAGNPLTSLSEEELCQCAKSAGNGCQGGWMDKAIQWVVNNGGINSEAAYPYTSGSGRTGICNAAKSRVSVAKFSAVVEVPRDESAIASFLQQHGPLSIGVDAQDGWQTYHGGIKTTCSGRSIDHGVTLVGFGPNYWIVKNSWGLGWGEQGYIRLARGVNCDAMANTVCTARV